MELYCGIDLHSNNNWIAIQNREREDVAGRRIGNELGKVLRFLEPYREEIVAVAVESTYNWYWLVDGLKEAGYDVRLMNTTKASLYSDMKYTDDKHDARRIAHLLSLGILPEGFITPPKDRGPRDLLRRRSFLTQKRTAHLLAIQTIFARNTGKQVSTRTIEEWDAAAVRKIVADHMVAESISVMLPIVRVLNRQIKKVEKHVLVNGRLRKEFEILTTVPGIGKILALTIMYETADINRFAKVGNYVSYCRCAKSVHTSNDKKKGAGNRKNGNRYLSWAFSEAAHHSTRYEPLAKRFYDRKKPRCLPIVAKRALAAKLARACYFMLKNQVRFDASRAFGK